MSNYSLADLELMYLKTIVVVPGPSLADARLQAYGANERDYFAGLSGLVPAQPASLADHQLAYYRSVSGIPTADLSFAKRTFWATALGV